MNGMFLTVANGIPFKQNIKEKATLNFSFEFSKACNLCYLLSIQFSAENSFYPKNKKNAKQSNDDDNSNNNRNNETNTIWIVE